MADETRRTYDIRGRQFTMRLITLRDYIRGFAKLPALPVLEYDEGEDKIPKDWEQLARIFDSNDQILCLCSVMPKLILGDPFTVLDGQFPVNELPQETYDELLKLLRRDSGLSKEAAEEIRPSVGTPTSS